jgi:hypothetical protein
MVAWWRWFSAGGGGDFNVSTRSRTARRRKTHVGHRHSDRWKWSEWGRREVERVGAAGSGASGGGGKWSEWGRREVEREGAADARARTFVDTMAA